jgi:hypothetical protein
MRSDKTNIPENDEQELFDAMREQLSPEAIASIIAHVQGAATNNPDVDRQVSWFRDRLTELLGGSEHHARLMDELGL